MKFVCIWYNMDSEVKRDIIHANSSEEASMKVHAKYQPGCEPAPCISIVPESGSSNYCCDVPLR